MSPSGLEMRAFPSELAGVALVPFAVGLGVLVFGRRLYWLAIAGLGFVVGLALARRFLHLGTSGAETLIAAGLGVLGALVAIAAQRFALAVAGLVAGGYATLWLLAAFAIRLGRLEALAAMALGALAGLLLARTLFDFALVALSALVGALLLTEALPLPPPARPWAFLLLVVLGVWAQAKKPPRPAAT